MPAFGITDRVEMQAIKDNLARLNLVTRPLGIIPSLSKGQADTGDYTGPLYLTTLGSLFIEACIYPERLR